MNATRWTRLTSRPLILALAGAGLAVISAPAQSTADAAADAKTLAKYDTNKNGKLDPSEQAAKQADEAKAASDASPAEVVQLSPFSVQSSKSDIGYFASNTLAGSRLNSKIGDLASPITVITKQQLEDTNSRDLNDVFLYEANTEGSRNYTPIEVNRSGIKDRVGGSATNDIGANTAATANRVRGIAPADMTWNYYASISRLRADTYNADSLEISRGPNSILAGLGSPAGILNQTIGTGRINANTAEVNVAVDNNGSHRESLSFTRTLIKDKLAVNFAALYDDREFSRKPSYDLSRRQMGGFTFKPFSKTTFKGFVEGYTNRSRTPNEITPRDGITPWLSGGRPVWNPLTRQVTFLDTNVTTAPYRTSDTQVIVVNGANVTLTGDSILTDRRSPRFVPGLGFGSYTRPTKFINPDGSYFWSQGQASVFNIYNLTAAQVSAVATADPGYFDIFQRRISNSALTPAPAAWDVVGTSVYVPASITNRSLYDYKKVNVAAANFGSMRNGTYNLEVEQQLLPNLHFSAGWSQFGSA